MSLIESTTHHELAEPMLAKAALAETGPGASVGDYVALMKPRVMSLVVFTALTGLVIAPGSVHPVLAIAALVCIAIGAGAAGALNMWWDADIDARMQRTATRPVPRGRIEAEQALAFGMVLAVGSVVSLGLMVNWTAAILLALTIFHYVVIYTIALKRRTPQNIVIGGAAGSFPPMIGWAAATGAVGIESIVLFAIIFMWTPPHFWALALNRARDYARAGVPMLPVVAGPDETRRQILLYSLVLAPLAMLPVALGFAGALYGVVAAALGFWLLVHAGRVYRTRQGQLALHAAKGLFNFSILYLFGLFAALLVEHGLEISGAALASIWR